MNWQAWSKDEDVTLDCVPNSMSRRIWQERVRLGRTRPQVCEITGITMRRLEGLETRERPPTLVDIGMFVELIGMDSQYILIGQRSVELGSDEAALLDNYRNSSPGNKAVLRKVGAALEKQVDDEGDAHCA